MAANSNQKRTSGAGTRRKMTAKEYRARKRKKYIIFAVELIVILAMVAILYVVMTQASEGPKVTVLEPEQLEIPEEVETNETMKGYMNVALFGVDAQTDSELYKGSNSDSIMIASINMDTGDIKLVSVYRDTFLNVERIITASVIMLMPQAARSRR